MVIAQTIAERDRVPRAVFFERVAEGWCVYQTGDPIPSISPGSSTDPDPIVISTEYQSFPGKGSVPAKFRPAAKKLSQDLHLFDLITSESEQAAILGNVSVLDASDYINRALEYLADFPQGGVLNMPTGGVKAANIVQYPKTHIKGVAPPVFNETGSEVSGSILYLLPGSTVPLLRNYDGGWVRNPGAEIDGLPQYYAQASCINMTLHVNGNDDLRAMALKLERLWGYQLAQCYLKTSNGNFAAQLLDCNALRINDLTTVGTVFMDSTADSQFHFWQASGAGLSKTWPTLWIAGAAGTGWKNQFVQVFPFNNSLNAGAPTWTFTLVGPTLALSSSHVLQDEVPVIVTSTGVLPAGLAEATTYFVKRIDGDAIQLATSRKNARDGVVITPTDAGTGTHTVQIGKSANVYLNDGSKLNTFTAFRPDQSYGAAIHLDGAHDNTFSDILLMETGLKNNEAQTALMLTNGAYGNNFPSGTIDGTTVGLSNQKIGIYEDASSVGRNNFGAALNVKNHLTANYSAAGVLGELHTMFLGSDRFEAISGTPAVGLIGGNRRNGWMFDGAADEIIGAEIALPAGWRRVGFRLVWSNAGAGSGSVVWIVNAGHFGVGVTLNTADQGGSAETAAAAGAQDVVVHTDLFCDPSFSTARGELLYLRIKRVATATGDTLTNDAALVGVIVSRIPD